MKYILIIIFTLGMTARAEDKPANPDANAPVASTEQNHKISREQLTEEERRILDRGEIDDTSYIVGGIVGIYPGLGIGHAIQGRFSEKGWIFLAGELGSGAVMMVGLIGCIGDSFSRSDGRDHSCSMMTLGLLGYAGFRIWEIIDVWAAPPEHNRQYRAIKSRMAGADKPQFFIAQAHDTPILGIKLSF